MRSISKLAFVGPTSIGLLLTLGLAAPAVAGGKNEPPAPPAEDPFAKTCDAFGPGYKLVPGTTTCIKIGGYVRGSVTVTQKPGSGDFVPGSGTSPDGAKPR